MQYARTEDGDKLVFELDGAFTFRDADVWKEIIGHVNKTGLKKVTIDMNRITFIDSVAFGQFMVIKEVCADRGIRLRLRGASTQFNTIVSHFQITKLFEFE